MKRKVLPKKIYIYSLNSFRVTYICSYQRVRDGQSEKRTAARTTPCTGISQPPLWAGGGDKKINAEISRQI